MVVTRSRLHAVRMKQAIEAYIAKQGLHRPARPSSRSPAQSSTPTTPATRTTPRRATPRHA